MPNPYGTPTNLIQNRVPKTTGMRTMRMIPDESSDAILTGNTAAAAASIKSTGGTTTRLLDTTMRQMNSAPLTGHPQACSTINSTLDVFLPEAIHLIIEQEDGRLRRVDVGKGKSIRLREVVAGGQPWRPFIEEYSPLDSLSMIGKPTDTGVLNDVEKMQAVIDYEGLVYAPSELMMKTDDSAGIYLFNKMHTTMSYKIMCDDDALCVDQSSGEIEAYGYQKLNIDSAGIKEPSLIQLLSHPYDSKFRGSTSQFFDKLGSDSVKVGNITVHPI